ncbi:MAG: M20/M25/M40 family metallo-hydrolase [Anaerolineales bacterium]|nr:M20/M25/M40 family metallo-hydrolase [Anaerolineales bacterium]
MTATSPKIYQRPVELLQKLLRFDTTNPPGNERPLMEFLHELMTSAGIEARLLGLDPERPNLVARLPGDGQAPPLLLYGHADVVTTTGQDWQHPPFEGRIVDGYIWGRGTLDMKGGLAMLISAFLKAKAETLPLAGDLILAVVSDEEALGEYGAEYLVKQHPQLFEGVHYALGEFGGFSLQMGARRFYPIMIAEKQACWLRIRLQGPGGHASSPIRGGAMAKLGRVLTRLDQTHLPVHITEPARLMVTALADGLGGLPGLFLRQLLNPRLTDPILSLMGARGQVFAPLFHNTVSPTIVRGGDKTNVIPSEISLELDGRLLPGLQPQDLIGELKQILGQELVFEITNYKPGPAQPDMGLFDLLADSLRRADPEGIPIPLLLSATTDGRVFNQLGIQTYGFLPMQLPPDFNFTATVHAANERIPEAALQFGSDRIYDVLEHYGR